MQALITTSRSINQDPFLERQNKRKYENHVKKVGSINQLKCYPILSQVKQTQKMTKSLYKAKQSAKTFRESQEKQQKKRQNRILLEKIWKINSAIKTDNNVMHLQHQSGSNWFYKKKQTETIKHENERLAINLIKTKVDVKNYKKKLEGQIKQYLELRNNIRKFNLESGEKKKRVQRVQSQKKGFRLTLKQLQEDQNNKQDPDTKNENYTKTRINNQQAKNTQPHTQRLVNQGNSQNRKELDRKKNEKQLRPKNRSRSKNTQIAQKPAKGQKYKQQQQPQKQKISEEINEKNQ